MDTRGFQRSMDELLKVRPDISKTVPRVAGQIVKDCVKLTPPFGDHAFTETFGAQLKVGKGAVSNDIKKVFHTIQELDAVKESKKGSIGEALKKAARKGDRNLVILLLERLKLRPTSFDPEPTTAHHGSTRNNKGRTVKSRGQFFVAGGINDYIRVVQKRVGEAKNGWTASVRKLNVKGIPAWITRQTGPSGTCEIKGAGTVQVSVTFENTVPFIQAKGRELGIMRAAFRSVGVKLEREVKAILAARFRKAKSA